MMASSEKLRPGQVVSPTYISRNVEISDDFLRRKPQDAVPITASRINFAETDIPEFAGYYAVVLDNVLSQSECDLLLEYAEKSAGAGEQGVDKNGWRKALVNIGMNREAFYPDYRNSDRIIWDNADIADRIWARCLETDEVAKDLAVIGDNFKIHGRRVVKEGQQWELVKLNERLRFLRYEPGQFFQGTGICKDPQSDMTIANNSYSSH
jgi:hypothetical protein